ncbi:MAG TPA: metallophosphoesterase [Burkholderiaceae bacterium]|nr:metallophosphoesterase [Burkholderiaceae bacterium]
MRRLVNPFIFVFTAVVAAGYAYLAWRLATSPASRLALAMPFLLVWLVPVSFLVGARGSRNAAIELLHRLGYLSMAWLSFLFAATVARDAALVATAFGPLAAWQPAVADAGVPAVLVASVAALAIGMQVAARGPAVRHVDVPIEGLDPALDGYRIAQISDLHVGLGIRAPYVERVVRQVHELEPDITVLTGDIVDGSVAALAADVAPLAKLADRAPVFFVLGNHDCYSGAKPWIAQFEAMNMTVLLNSHVVLGRQHARIVVAGVVDPAARWSGFPEGPRPDQSLAGSPEPAFRLLLAHNPKLASSAERAGFDLQLSGHTHAGQFFPWTLAVHLVHAPHVVGLSRQGRMRVYVSAGTGTWGPPVRFGTKPELTLLRLVRA